MKTFPLRVMWNRIAPVFLQYRNLVENPDEITRKLESFYFKGKSARQANISAFAEVKQLDSVLNLQINTIFQGLIFVCD